MNCDTVQEWLPLYVSRDLEEERRRHTAEHLQGCADCAELATEYDATRQVLADPAPAPFDESVYSEIRRQVLREIERKNYENRRTFFGWLTPGYAWALASVLMLAIGVGAYYFVSSRALQDSRQSRTNPDTPQPPSSPPAASEKLAVKNQPVHRPQLSKYPRQLTSPAKHREPAIVSEAAVESNRLPAPNAVPSSEKVFRLEMQTKDPNIRIIWLTPRPTTHDVPGKISRGV